MTTPFILNLVTVSTEHLFIGTCRAVWVPRQDLSTPHLMCNCGKRILSLHCMLYVRLCTHNMLYAGEHVSLRSVLVVWVCMIPNNPGNAWVCPGLQAPMHLLHVSTKHFKCSLSSIFTAQTGYVLGQTQRANESPQSGTVPFGKGLVRTLLTL